MIAENSPHEEAGREYSRAMGKVGQFALESSLARKRWGDRTGSLQGSLLCRTMRKPPPELPVKTSILITNKREGKDSKSWVSWFCDCATVCRSQHCHNQRVSIRRPLPRLKSTAQHCYLKHPPFAKTIVAEHCCPSSITGRRAYKVAWSPGYTKRRAIYCFK